MAEMNFRITGLIVALASQPVPQKLGPVRAIMARRTTDMEFGGRGRIFGTVARKNLPANVPMRSRVRLHRSKDGLLVRETWSDDSGYYEFREISERYEYDVIAWDHQLQDYSAVANNQLAEVMP